ncbi:DUF2249 domain-containing protein [Ottowia sp.]|uniref:DUF2249 domain-containing protein n=1 Tax=Ottowia sp. TaxID=1898956 RepID=UPI002BB26CDE|nr:DUF2249 domain-containing protein [Ottowia sp.]HRN75039.1 DUF2249 domain-containing protein [Ottowia sp.]HRQ02143.1 DUF2249 domain-containing protein [Ottowia sp.]
MNAPIERIFVPSVPPPERHATIFAAFDALPVGGAFEILNDHDPMPLMFQFERTRSGQFDWEYLQRGPEQFLVRISRLEAAAGAVVAGAAGAHGASGGCGCSGG